LLLAELNPEGVVLVIDTDSQANTSEQLFTELKKDPTTVAPGKEKVHKLMEEQHPGFPDLSPTLLGYLHGFINGRLNNFQDYAAGFTTQVCKMNPNAPENLYVLSGDYDGDLLQAELSRKLALPQEALTHHMKQVGLSLKMFAEKFAKEMCKPVTLIVDTNPAMSALTKVSLLSTKKLILPLNADAFSTNALARAFPLVYGRNLTGRQAVEHLIPDMFPIKAHRERLRPAKIHLIIGNNVHLRNNEKAGEKAAVAVANRAFDTQCRQLFAEFQRLCRGPDGPDLNGPNTPKIKQFINLDAEDVFNVDQRLSSDGVVAKERLLQAGRGGNVTDEDHDYKLFKTTFCGQVGDMRSSGIAAALTGLPLWLLKRNSGVIRELFDFNVAVGPILNALTCFLGPEVDAHHDDGEQLGVINQMLGTAPGALPGKKRIFVMAGQNQKAAKANMA
jgi:cellulose biosynthesis protein BcsQ